MCLYFDTAMIFLDSPGKSTNHPSSQAHTCWGILGVAATVGVQVWVAVIEGVGVLLVVAVPVGLFVQLADEVAVISGRGVEVLPGTVVIVMVSVAVQVYVCVNAGVAVEEKVGVQLAEG
ncbi:hypothetical protein JW933_08080, partial [candidate division FCPU426 bacterium]|nr:hypothetical protein [candidate division FCPU426 bacterium]